MKTKARKSPPTAASAALKKLAGRIATAHHEATATKSVAQAAKADYKRARKAYKHARQLAKAARKALKGLKEELLVLKEKMARATRNKRKPKVVKTAAKKVLHAKPAPDPTPAVMPASEALPPLIETPADSPPSPPIA